MEIVEHMTDATERTQAVVAGPKDEIRRGSGAGARARALLVSAADKLHNVQSLLRDYRRQGDELWARFNPEAGKSGMIGYYSALADVFGRRMPGALSDELGRAVTMLQEIAGERGAWPPTP